MTVKLSASGQIDITGAGGSIDLNIDVEGYFMPGSGSDYVPIAAERSCDTRPGNASSLSGFAAQCNGASNVGETIPAGATLNVNVARLTTGVTTPIPANTTAAVLDVIAVDEAAVGWLEVYPAGTTRQWASTLNFQLSTISNEVTAGIGSNGQITIYAAAKTDVIIDVEGYTNKACPSAADQPWRARPPAEQPFQPDITQPATKATDRGET